MRKSSILEILHPDGIAQTSFVLGRNCPAILQPGSQKTSAENIELFILAPGTEECESKKWIEAAVQSMVHGLSVDGVGYMLVSPRWRWKIIRSLRKAGLVMDAYFWHFPSWSQSQYLVPMEKGPALFALNAILAVPHSRRALVRQMFPMANMRRLLAVVWKPVGISIRRPGARPLFKWFFQQECPSSLPASAIIRTSWRGSMGASIAYGFSGNQLFPSMIAKTIPLENASEPEREARVLKELGPAARLAGARVPEIIRKQQIDRRSTILVSFLPGKSISDVLRSHPDRFFESMTMIVDWLERWHRLTVVVQPLEWEQCERALLLPLERLAPLLKGAEMYRDWLVDRMQSALAHPVPLVAAHNDLTMANILLDDHKQLGVVDWETGCLESLPLVDFYYALADSVRITANCTDLLEAFKPCYLTEGYYSAKAAAWEGQLRSAINLPADVAELCFHACWLHHALNEYQASQAGESRPFLDIVQWLALHAPKIERSHN